MCGIIGYSGRRPAAAIILDSLVKLEYRGYDSCGVAVDNPGLTVYKDAVRVAELQGSIPVVNSTNGIGHTRWATHGAPCRENAHPHQDCSGRIAVVHNGVITNYQSLRKQLRETGHRFTSETDTEVIPHLIEKYLPNSDLITAVQSAVRELQGSFAIIVKAEGQSALVFARRENPLILGVGDRENFVASDIPAILDYTNRVVYLEDGDIGVITPDSYLIYQNGNPISRPVQKIDWTPEQARKGGYRHFLLKEIREQPRVIRDTLSDYLASPEAWLDITQSLDKCKTLIPVACGTSYHAALVGKYVIEQLTKIQVRPEMASEFNYLSQSPQATLGIGITQSGETADTLKAMRRLKENGAQVLAITNTVGSSAVRIADSVMYTRAGPEMSVAATKTFTSQLIALYWLAISNLSGDTLKYHELVAGLRQLPEKVEEILENEAPFITAAGQLAGYTNVFYTGRGVNLAIAMEGALKFKEISYLGCEACAAGEMKHGTFALLNKDLPVVAIVAPDNTRGAMLTSLKEIKARGSPLFVIGPEGDEEAFETADFALGIPAVDGMFSPFLNTVAVQLLAYYTALKLGRPIDFPRNLAKSVTVE